jgi:hypothetical protein
MKIITDILFDIIVLNNFWPIQVIKSLSEPIKMRILTGIWIGQMAEIAQNHRYDS